MKTDKPNTNCDFERRDEPEKPLQEEPAMNEEAPVTGEKAVTIQDAQGPKGLTSTANQNMSYYAYTPTDFTYTPTFQQTVSRETEESSHE